MPDDRITVVTGGASGIGQATAKRFARGGDFIVKTLKGVVETGKPPFMSRFILLMISMLSWTTPKACLSENWPLDKKIE